MLNLEGDMMKKANIRMALFTGLFVGIIVFLSEYIIPNTNLITSVLLAGLSALVGGLIGNKLFPNK
jgi:xanthosine utilization system XapX-like protein